MSRIVLSAGGSGGHLFPAEALARVLTSRGHEVVLVTDERAIGFAKDFPAKSLMAIPSATPSRAGLLEKVRAAGVLARGVYTAWKEFGISRPDLVVGFGGYPTVPPLLAAQLRGVKTLIHEQNSVMGRANRFLFKRATALATGFPDLHPKGRWTGNPVREEVIAAASQPYVPVLSEGEIRLVVFGGSQGARVMADVVPPALELLSEALRKRLRLVQQVRKDDHKRVEAIYTRAHVQAQLAPFFDDLPMRMAQAHLIISRSGASTVSELGALGRPSILVPLPDALDQDQAANAGTLVSVGAALVMPQVSFTPLWLSRELERLFSSPDPLTAMAAAAKTRGVLDASVRLANVVDALVKV